MSDPTSPRHGLNPALVVCCGITILISAFLLFQVQPLISKIILPWFGGSPAVWTSCMLFFQVLLLVGYTYAHFLVRLRSFMAQAAIHCVVIAAALAVLPITPGAQWRPDTPGEPTWKILSILGASVGLPFFVLSSTAPLVQAWFSRASGGASPYRLYALSNVGSLTALLSYPFLIEPWLDTTTQDRIWSIGFAMFALLCLLLCAGIWSGTRRRLGGLQLEAELAAAGTRRPQLLDRLGWLLLPALASMLLLAVTNHVCQDVAVVPFLWVVPLSLYLLSFIICFDNESWYLRRFFALTSALAVLLICIMLLEYEVDMLLLRWDMKLEELLDRDVSFYYDISTWTDYIVFEAGAYLLFLFLLCMLCHGELVRLKPPTRWLTSFYLSIAAGGALGGIFVALICPALFSGYWEMNIGLVAGFILAAAVLWVDGRHRWLEGRPVLQWAGAFALAGGTLLVAKAQVEAFDADSLISVRNFYGVLRVEDYHDSDDPEESTRSLYNGRILHGVQLLESQDANLPASYYDRQSGIGIAMTHYNRPHPWRVAVIGLGTGNMAAYGKLGDYYQFYEINPAVPPIATDYFTYVESSPATVKIVLGDARLSMEREAPQQYDIIVLDAFSGDAIPTHLLTKEALNVYQRHLRPGGIIAFHISNLHLDLLPVVAGLAEYGRFEAVKIVNHEDYGPVDAMSDWMLLTRNQEFLQDEAVQAVAEDYEGTYEPVPLWTDQYSNLFRILE